MNWFSIAVWAVMTILGAIFINKIWKMKAAWWVKISLLVGVYTMLLVFGIIGCTIRNQTIQGVQYESVCQNLNQEMVEIGEIAWVLLEIQKDLRQYLEVLASNSLPEEERQATMLFFKFGMQSTKLAFNQVLTRVEYIKNIGPKYGCRLPKLPNKAELWLE